MHFLLDTFLVVILLRESFKPLRWTLKSCRLPRSEMVSATSATKSGATNQFEKFAVLRIRILK